MTGLGVTLTFYALAAIAALWTWQACRDAAAANNDREDD